MIIELMRFANTPAIQSIKSKTEEESVLTKVTVPVTYEANGKYHIINIEAWEKQAEYIAKTFSKGEWAYITGNLIRNEWKDANGYKRHDFYISVISISTLPGSKIKTAEQAKDEAIGTYYDFGLNDLPPILQD